jgi:hypothetical protein
LSVTPITEKKPKKKAEKEKLEKRADALVDEADKLTGEKEYKKALTRYDKALDRRMRWWPGSTAADFLSLKEAVARRLEDLCQP